MGSGEGGSVALLFEVEGSPGVRLEFILELGSRGEVTIVSPALGVVARVGSGFDVRLELELRAFSGSGEPNTETAGPNRIGIIVCCCERGDPMDGGKA